MRADLHDAHRGRDADLDVRRIWRRARGVLAALAALEALGAAPVGLEKSMLGQFGGEDSMKGRGRARAIFGMARTTAMMFSCAALIERSADAIATRATRVFAMTGCIVKRKRHLRGYAAMTT